MFLLLILNKKIKLKNSNLTLIFIALLIWQFVFDIYVLHNIESSWLPSFSEKKISNYSLIFPYIAKKQVESYTEFVRDTNKLMLRRVSSTCSSLGNELCISSARTNLDMSVYKELQNRCIRNSEDKHCIVYINVAIGLGLIEENKAVLETICSKEEYFSECSKVVIKYDLSIDDLSSMYKIASLKFKTEIKKIINKRLVYEIETSQDAIMRFEEISKEDKLLFELNSYLLSSKARKRYWAERICHGAEKSNYLEFCEVAFEASSLTQKIEILKTICDNLVSNMCITKSKKIKNRARVNAELGSHLKNYCVKRKYNKNNLECNIILTQREGV
ncbi:hypothetical protein [Halobacteriovorax sp. HLS]|uniref:hypothetical protein n=1 Tax=Halobacteriovorax sp. HLS TaxID=2234000 RepID=UPI0013E3F6F2|nr:hypothetical protein [Halobacteriovorax sp. HLS]